MRARGLATFSPPARFRRPLSLITLVCHPTGPAVPTPAPPACHSPSQQNPCTSPRPRHNDGGSGPQQRLQRAARPGGRHYAAAAASGGGAAAHGGAHGTGQQQQHCQRRGGQGQARLDRWVSAGHGRGVAEAVWGRASKQAAGSSAQQQRVQALQNEPTLPPSDVLFCRQPHAVPHRQRSHQLQAAVCADEGAKGRGEKEAGTDSQAGTRAASATWRGGAPQASSGSLQDVPSPPTHPPAHLHCNHALPRWAHPA